MKRGPLSSLTRESWFLRIAAICLIAIIASEVVLGWSLVTFLTIIAALIIVGVPAILILSTRKELGAALLVFFLIVGCFFLLCLLPMNPPGGLIQFMHSPS